MRVSIIYGGFEGSWHGKLLRRELKASGHTITRDPRNADVIIAHSGGCYTIPPQSMAKVILLVGLPHWPGKSLLRGLGEKLRLEQKDRRLLIKTCFNTFYMLAHPLRWLAMHRALKSQRWPTDSDATVVAVRNEHDPFMHPTSIVDLAREREWQLKLLGGHHDDLWINPQPYIEIISEAI